MYKLLTSPLTNPLQSHLETNHIFQTAQTTCSYIWHFTKPSENNTDNQISKYKPYSITYIILQLWKSGIKWNLKKKKKNTVKKCPTNNQIHMGG